MFGFSILSLLSSLVSLLVLLLLFVFLVVVMRHPPIQGMLYVPTGIYLSIYLSMVMYINSSPLFFLLSKYLGPT